MIRLACRLFLTVALLGCLALPLTGAPSKSKIPTVKDLEARARMIKPSAAEPGATEVVGQFYTVRSYLEPELTAEISFFMDNYWQAFTGIFAKDRFKIKDKPVFIVYQGQEQFLTMNNMNNKGLLGFFRPSDRMLRAFVDDKNVEKGLYDFQNSLFRQVSQHEATHQLLYWLLGTMDIPFWFNEGSADFFGSWNGARPFDLNRNASFIDNIHISTVWDRMKEGNMVDIRYFTSLEEGGKFQSGPVIYHYGSSYAFISFMLSERANFVAWYNQLWNDIKGGKTTLYDEYFTEKQVEKHDMQNKFNKFLMEWYSYSYVRFLPPWQAPVAKLEFLADFMEDQKKTKKQCYLQACKDVVQEYTGREFADGAEIKKWIKENEDYLIYSCDNTMEYENPGLNVDPFYYEYNNFAVLGGLYGTLTYSQVAADLKIPSHLWQLMSKSELRKAESLSLQDVDELRAKLQARWDEGKKEREATLEGLKDALQRLRKGETR